MKEVRLHDYKRGRKHKAKVVEHEGRLCISFGYNKNLLQEIKGLEGAKWHPDDKYWSCLLPSESMRNTLTLGYLTANEIGSDEDLKRYLKPVTPTESHRPLYAHQSDFLNRVLSYQRFMIAGEMGTGKTLALIEAMERIKEAKLGGPDEDLFWIIAPKSALRAWVEELRKWDAKIKPRLITASAPSISKAVSSVDTPPLVLVLDESSVFKNMKAQRTSYVYQLSCMMRKAWHGKEYVIEMTGTPSPRDPTDWWSQVEILQPGWLREKNRSQLQRRLAYLEEQEGPHGVYWKVLGWNEEEIRDLSHRLDPIRVVCFKKDCLDLPDKQYRRIILTPPPEVLTAAKVLARSCATTLEALNRIRQLSDGFQYEKEYIETTEPDGTASARELRTTQFVTTPKDEALKDILEEHVNTEANRVVIYAGFTASVDKVTQLCLDEGWDVIRVDGRGWKVFSGVPGHQEVLSGAESELSIFQDKESYPRPTAFVANPESGGMGITLTASPTIVYYSNSFKAESRIQSEDRIHRPGLDPNRGATIVDFIYLPTDELILGNLKMKRDMQSLSLGQIKEVLGD